ncbi:metallophosphoesterase [Paracoccus salipaludis]|uniref:metallophosphoesterase n=1 Tax=Paracoccus salipaludis TaxID=2032623 RepID=UPI0030843616
MADNPAQGLPGFFGSLEGLIDLQRVWVIPGNHDYHGWRLDDDDGLAAIAAQAGVNFAQKQVIDIGASRFLCCTLWTDFALMDDVPGAMMSALLTMPDYRQITFGPEHRPLKPGDLLKLHMDHLAWLEAQLREPFAGPTFVITHHAPHRAVAGSLYSASPAFASNLDSFIRHYQPDAWLFGHTHRRLETWIGGTLIRNVSLGYPHEVNSQHERTLLLRGIIEEGALGAA